MSMTTEQALAYMHGEQPTVADSKTPSVEESKSEEINVDSPNEVATKPELRLTMTANIQQKKLKEVMSLRPKMLMLRKIIKKFMTIRLKEIMPLLSRRTN